MVEEVVSLLIGEDVGEALKIEELGGRVADDFFRVLAHDTDGEAAICFFPQSNKEAKGLNGTGGMDGLVLAALQDAVVACNDGVAVVGHDVSKASSHEAPVWRFAWRVGA